MFGGGLELVVYGVQAALNLFGACSRIYGDKGSCFFVHAITVTT